MAFVPPPEPRQRRTMGFSVATMLLVVSVVCIGLGYSRLRHGHSVTAFLEVRFLAASPAFAAQNHAAHVELITSRDVISAALDASGLRSLRTVATQADPVAWLADRLQAKFASDSTVLELRLEGRRVAGESASDDETLLMAVINAYRATLGDPPKWFVDRELCEVTVHVIQHPLSDEF